MKSVSSINSHLKVTSPQQWLVVVGTLKQPNHPSDYANRRSGSSTGTH